MRFLSLSRSRVPTPFLPERATVAELMAARAAAARSTTVKRGGSPLAQRARLLALGLALVLGAAGCNSLFKNDELPPEVTDPAITKTPKGALAAYNGTLAQFAVAYGYSGSAGGSFVQETGLFSDELHVLPFKLNSSRGLPGDSRLLTEASTLGNVYSNLQRVRGQAGQAIGLLTDYRHEEPALRSRVYALEGYAEVFLAELFCSGIPLSTLDYHGEYTLRPGSTTEAVFTHAAALFDSALALAGGSTAFLHLAAVGKARALLGLGQYAEAAAVVGAVPDAYTYTISYTRADELGASNGAKNFADSTDYKTNVADVEGGNGLDYRTSGDPRTSVRRVLSNENSASGLSDSVWFPTKYATDGTSPLVLASGVEARLIEAEAALQAGDLTTWLDKLNHLRQMAPSVNPAWPVLPDTTDPGTAAGRVDLLFRERAFWLFLTGHRQGDLRRLIRQYGRTQDQVYPSGPTGSPPYPVYGNDVTAPIPASERTLNPLFTGCISPDA